MKQKRIVAGVILVLALIGASGGLWVRQHQQPVAPARPVATQQAPATYHSYMGVEGKTALSLLKSKAAVITKESTYGPFVESIGGLAGGANGKYWLFYVNGAQAAVGADSYVTKAGDKIEWKLE